MKVPTRATVLKKQCVCKGTSSGPRCVNRLVQRDGQNEDTIVMSQTLYLFVCDVCNKEWKFEEVESTMEEEV